MGLVDGEWDRCSLRLAFLNDGGGRVWDGGEGLGW